MIKKIELTPLGQIIWEDRYGLKDDKGTLIEKDILETFQRVSKFIAAKEKDPDYWKNAFFEIMAKGHYTPAGRILAQAGTNYSQLFNCFVLPFEDDSLEAIMDTAKNIAVIQKHGGGTGMNYSILRPAGAYIKGVNGRSCGVLGFINMMSVVSEVIEQGGCFVADTLVATPQGPKKIIDLKKDDVVYSMSKEGFEEKPCSCDAWRTKENAEVWKVTTNEGQIFFCTKDHPLMPSKGFDFNKNNYLKVQDISNEAIMSLDNRDSFKSGEVLISAEFSHYSDVWNVEVCDLHNFVVCNDDMTCGVVVSNSRRGANLGLLEVTHPDVWEFISYKNEHNWDKMKEFLTVQDEEKWSYFKYENLYKLQMYNISVGITDEFLTALKNDSFWPLKWKDTEWDLYTVVYKKSKGNNQFIEKNFEVTADSDKTAIWKVRKIVPFPKSTDIFEISGKRRIKAKEIWDRICYNAWADGCPGIINVSRMRSMHNLEYARPFLSVNPCLTGDTLVAVADGRVAVPIKQLAEEGKDVPVYCRDNNGNPAIKMMRHPRVTNPMAEVYKITLDDGSIIKATANHEICLSSGFKKPASDLKYGDSLHIMNKVSASFHDVIENCNSTSVKDYYWIGDNPEHRLIYEFYKGKIPYGHIIHHFNYDTKDNRIDNLMCMTVNAHNELHRQDKLGDKNPMRRAQTEWSDEKWQSYHDNMSAAVAGELNGRFSGISNEKLMEKAIELSKIHGRKLSTHEWEEFALKNGYPSQFSKFRVEAFGTVTKFLGKAAELADVGGSDFSHANLREYQRYLKLKETSDLDLFFEDGVIKVNKVCEGCSKKFIVGFMQREVSYCSLPCSNKHRERTQEEKDKIWCAKENVRQRKRVQQVNAYNDLKLKLGRTPMKKEYAAYCKDNKIPFRLPVRREVATGILVGTFVDWDDLKVSAEMYNHRVVSVEKLTEKEPVYNGTVDEFHNFYFGGFRAVKGGKEIFSFTNGTNCGEQPLSSKNSCNLSSIILSSFVKDGVFDFDLFKQVVRIAVRFADNVIEACDYPIPDIKVRSLEERRVGLGTMGVHDMLIAMKLGYDTEEGRNFVESVLKVMRDEAYLASIDLAKEKGSFPILDKEKFLDSGFMKTMPQAIRMDILANGIRNSTLLTQAPTGSVGTMFNISTGCEPWPFLELQRNTRLGSYDDGCPGYLQWKKESPNANKIPEYFRTAQEISPEDHVKMMAIFSKYVDSAVSKTINIFSSATPEDISKAFLLAMDMGIKGLTVFRDGSKEGIFVNKASKDKKILEDAKKLVQNLEEVKQDFNCTEDAVIDSRMAPRKRGNRAAGATYRVYMQGHNLYITVNRNSVGELVEVFATVGESKAHDAFHTSGVEDSWAEGLGKIISLALRAGVTPASVIKNLKNIPSDKPVFVNIDDNSSSELIPSPPHAIARAMEEELKYSNVAQTKSNTGAPRKGHCEECGSDNIKFKSPTCYECLDCAYSRCS